MLKFKILVLFLALFAGFTNLNAGFAQESYTISGEIRDAQSGEALIGATVYPDENQARGITTNAYGFFSLTLPKGTYTIKAQFIGYERGIQTINLTQDRRVNLKLNESVISLNEVTVSAERQDRNIASTQMGNTKINIADVKNIPVLFGEKDVLKTIQLLPGVKSAGEGNSGFYVRGGGTDQNLILLDEATVYNPSHVMGFFSVFNSDAIKDVNLIKGGMPAEYGGRLSSVLDVKMKEGNDKEFHVNGGIGLISSHLTLEGPIQKEKSSFMISGRRTYADLFLKLSPNANLKNSSIYFYDLNMKMNFRLGEKDRLFVSGYFGRDDISLLRFSNAFQSLWGNATGTLRWNHLFNSKLFTNTSLIYSDFTYNMQLGSDSTQVNVQSAIRDFNLKQEWQYYLNQQHTLKSGFNSIYHSFIPGSVTGTSTISLQNSEIPKRYALENAIFVSDEYTVTSQLKVNAGLRISNFNLLGPTTIYGFDENGNITDTTAYKANQNIKTYWGIEPRLSTNLSLNESSSIKASYARTQQYVHLLSNATSYQSTDLWIPSSSIVKPQIANQYSIGYYKNFSNNLFETSAEVYYKEMQNQIEYKNGAQFVLNKTAEADLVFGKGKSYGIELYARKRYGKFNGWISYTLSFTDRTFADIDMGQPFPAKQDRRHELSVVGIYQVTPRLSLSGTWVYYTGNAVTFPSGKYLVDNRIITFYTERNGYRMPDYHRLDLAATWVQKKTRRFESSWSFSVYNVYNRMNAYSISFRPSTTVANQTEVVKLSLFPVIPSITYSFKF
jgi:hypothetical protein